MSQNSDFPLLVVLSLKGQVEWERNKISFFCGYSLKTEL